jgi:hypothetical protein
MKKLAIVLCAVALVGACNPDTGIESTACAMQTIQSEALMEAINDGKIVCIDDTWYVRLDKKRVYSYENGAVRAID